MAGGCNALEVSITSRHFKAEKLAHVRIGGSFRIKYELLKHLKRYRLILIQV